MANTTFSGPVRSENGFDFITKNATTGAVTTNASYDKGITGGVQSLSGAGAVDIVNLVTEVTTTGADALTLADGSSGQVKIITMIVDGGDATLTPTTLAGGSTITFNDVGDGVVLVYGTAGWVVVGSNGVTIA
jgi:chromosome condensin MukBEF ATPase and DNA-binding subunit MukB